MTKLTLDGVAYTPVPANPFKTFCAGCAADNRGEPSKLCESLPCNPSPQNNFNNVIFIKDEK